MEAKASPSGPYIPLFGHHARLMGKTEWYLDYYQIIEPDQLFEKNARICFTWIIR